VNTNPVVIRRLMALLKAKGLVASQPGTGGGWELLVAPDSITLLDVRRAVDEGSPFALHAQTPSPKCPVGRGIQGALRGVYARAELAMDNELAQTSVEQLLHAVQGHKPA
jgi:DNA-binding IscR family transcriptional regulator